MIRTDRLLKLARALIGIRSENPGGTEERIARFIQAYLRPYGIRASLVAFAPHRQNVLARVGNGAARHRLLITPHLDTVPAGSSWGRDPFKARIVGDRLYGLGATDCKGNLACSIEALTSLAEDRAALGYELIFAATADEETGSALGLVPLLQKKILRPDAALVLDADGFDIIVAQKGLLHLTVKLRGKRAHGAYPWRGHNAIMDAVSALQGLAKERLPGRPHRFLRASTVNVGTIRGGDKVNVVADWCDVELDFRFLPGSGVPQFLRLLRQVLKRHALRFRIEVQGQQKPYEIERSHPLVRTLVDQMRAGGVPARLCGSEGATTITFFQDHGIPAVATGFGAHGCAHTQDEFARVSALCRGARILERFLKAYQSES